MASISNFGKIPKTVVQQTTTKAQGGVYGVYGNAAKKAEESTELKKKSTVTYQPKNIAKNTQKPACTSNPYNDPYANGSSGGGGVYDVYGTNTPTDADTAKKAAVDKLKQQWGNPSEQDFKKYGDYYGPRRTGSVSVTVNGNSYTFKYSAFVVAVPDPYPEDPFGPTKIIRYDWIIKIDK